MPLRSAVLALALAVAAATASAASAQAAPPSVTTRYALDGHGIVAETKVPMSDLDLSTPYGLWALLARIKGAAVAVCGPVADDGRGREAFHACRDRAIADAVARMKTPKLTRMAADDRRWSAGR